MNQTTLSKHSRIITGPSLLNNSISSVRLYPADPNTGTVFIRTDLPGNPAIKCHPDNMGLGERWTYLENDNVQIHHTEHILCALNLVDNVIVECSSDCIPLVSGGGRGEFRDVVTQSGVELQSVECDTIVVKEPFIVEGAGCHIACIPSNKFSASYIFLFGGRVGYAEYHPLADDARIYVLDFEDVSDALGPIADNFIVVGPTSEQARFTEVAAHKIIDFVGDLAIVRKRVIGRFMAYRSGHKLNHVLVHKLMEAAA